MMDKRTLQDITKKHAPVQHKGRNTLIAFISRGTLVIVAQLFMVLCMDTLDLDKDTAVSATVITVILVTALLTRLGVYDKVAQKYGAGLFTPVSSFTNCLTSYTIEGRTKGPIFGIGSNMFKLAGLVLTYGIAATLVFDVIRYLPFGT